MLLNTLNTILLYKYFIIIGFLILVIISLYFIKRFNKKKKENTNISNIKIAFNKKIWLIPVILESVSSELSNFDSISKNIKKLYIQSLGTSNIYKMLELSILIDKELNFIKKIARKYKLHKTNWKFLYSTELYQDLDINLKLECKKYWYEI